MAIPCPDGISEDGARPRRGYHSHASPVSILVLTVFLALGFLGLFGGRPSPVRIAETDAVRLEVKTPTTLRNGLFFETVVRVTPKRPLNDLTLAISPSLWRDTTINTMVPAAEKEESRDGFFRLSYGPVDVGKPFEIKIDGQINPPLFLGTAGEIAVYDGDIRLAGVETRARVRP
jgi:hypothetical protein